MLFITAVRVNPGMAEEAKEFGDEILKAPPKGVKFLHVFHTLGRYDAIWIYEAADPEVLEDFLHQSKIVATTETWVAFARQM
jgi:uncharacterized protein with GYD domain